MIKWSHIFRCQNTNIWEDGLIQYKNDNIWGEHKNDNYDMILLYDDYIK